MHTNRNNYVILGPPGSGKGTQARKLVFHLNLMYLSTGEICRQLARDDNGIKSIIESGRLLSDIQITTLIRRYIKDNIAQIKNKGIIFDGFPRTLQQAKDLSIILDNLNIKLNIVFVIKLKLKESMNRILGRKICNVCSSIYNYEHSVGRSIHCATCNNVLIERSDDKVNTLKRRFEIYQKQTEVVIEYYNNAPDIVMLFIDGEQNEQQVFQQINKKLNIII
ncbi:MAG: nucleoside monophosphate kinase [Endomicrobium sp.]|jgi:adenylate kinase|nr:nucleoside monophosphate kinase [Endomicrobium sp.]